MHLVVVDIQPMYRSFIMPHHRQAVCRAIDTAEQVTFYYNGMDVGVVDKEYDVIEYLDLFDQVDKIHFIEKGYGFLRDWMDNGVGYEDIVAALRSDDDEDRGNEWGWIHDPELETPSVPFAHICGAFDGACLDEMEIYLEYHNVETKRLPSACI